jgi:hypothetical protein
MLFTFLGPKAQPFMNIRVQVWDSLLMTSSRELAENSTKYFQGWCSALMIPANDVSQRNIPLKGITVTYFSVIFTFGDWIIG